MRKLIDFVVRLVGKINWQWLRGKRYYKLTDRQFVEILYKLKENHYIILTRRDTHLSTWLINLGDFLLTGKWGFWSHALLNVEGDNVTSSKDFRFIEATAEGVHYSGVKEVLDCDSLALLVPCGFTEAEWSRALQKAAGCIGKPYDTLFDFRDSSASSCVELVMEAINDNATWRAGSKFTPESLYRSGAFKVVYLALN